MFEHYLEVGGVPLLNSEATESYVANLAPGISFRGQYGGDRIHVAVGDQQYRSPLLDDAPWANTNEPLTDDFYGLYPISITGDGGSTLSAETVESVQDGGTTSAGRHASRDIKVSGILVARTAIAAQAGLSWLRQAIQDAGCSTANTCASTDMRYFIAEPQVAEHAYGEEIDYQRRSFGSVGVGTTSYRWVSTEAPLEMPARARWEFSAREGTTLRFGARARTGVTDLDIYPMVQPYRVNRLPNPTLRADLSGWDVSRSTVTWVPQGGADGDSYGRVQVGTQGTQRRPYGVGTYGAGPYGAGTFEKSGTVDVRVQSVGSMPASPATFSVALRGLVGQAVDLQILSTSGDVLGHEQVAITDGWARYSVTAPIPGGLVTARIASLKSLDFDRGLMEAGSLAQPYFDGDTHAATDYVAAWTGTPGMSPSTQTWTGTAEICRNDSNFRMFIEVLQGSLDSLTLGWAVRREIEMDEQLEPWERTYHKVACTQGVQVVQEIVTESEGCFIQVEMLFTAGNPFAYSTPRNVSVVPLASRTYLDPPITPVNDNWLVDPDCLQITNPPAAPIIPGDCVDVITSWTRYYYSVPAKNVALWAATVPMLGLNSKGTAIKQVRARFHPNPFHYQADKVDPTAYCSEFIISYLPPKARLFLDGRTESAQASRAGSPTVPADHLLYGSDGGPIEWPELSCGIDYVMTLDIPSNSGTIDAFDIDLALARRE